ncbi:MAG: phosphate regulon sensor histidine kinase PhoR [Methylophilaceae bacterium]
MKLFLPFLIKCCLLITTLYFVLDLFFSQTTVLIIINLVTISFLFINYYQAIHFNNWLDKSKINELPNGLGIWEMIFSKIYKQNQVQTKIQNDLNLTLEQFTSAAEAMLDGVIAVNKNDEVIWCNRQAEAMLKINLKKSYKRPIGYTFRNTEFNDYLLKGDYSETLKVYDFSNKKNLEFKISPFRSNMKLIICKDITQIITNENLRKEFVSNFSHELKTPLTVIIGFLETLDTTKNNLDEGTKKIFELMNDQAIRMRKLIDDLLLLSNVESNPMEDRSLKISSNKFFNKLQKEAKLINNKNHKINFDIDQNIIFIGSEKELESAFINLISNAIRYTKERGQINIKWSLVLGRPTFEINDNGIGIPKNHIKRITERFFRVDAARSRDTGGTGLGLSIVKNIIEQHDGLLKISSEIGKGSKFIITFPKERLV